MLTYELKKMPGLPLYESLYRCIRQDILTGQLTPGQKLPSKRALATNLEVSKITVEGAYDQLLSEGYIRSVEKVGYFVEDLTQFQTPDTGFAKLDFFPQQEKTSGETLIDLTGNEPAKFPFSVWSRLQREVMLDLGESLLAPLSNCGLWELRQAIASHLYQFRRMRIDPGNILVGAGTDFLYNLLVQLLGREQIYAVEDPGYGKTGRIYRSAGAGCVCAPLDDQGVMPQCLGDAGVLHISPSHHYPTGIVMPLQRRQALLSWAYGKEDRWIIEDDYDSEFRFHARPIAAMQTMAPDRVIYLNTFSKSLAPSIRISYMVLPPQLMARFHRELGFYSCTVPSFEQYTLARFLQGGHFEKHINRMRKFYKSRRNRILAAVGSCPVQDKLTILEQNAGLHFLVRVETDLSDPELTELCRQRGLLVRTLGSYYHNGAPGDTHTLVVNYSGLSDRDVATLEQILKEL